MAVIFILDPIEESKKMFKVLALVKTQIQPTCCKSFCNLSLVAVILNLDHIEEFNKMFKVLALFKVKDDHIFVAECHGLLV